MASVAIDDVCVDTEEECCLLEVAFDPMYPELEDGLDDELLAESELEESLWYSSTIGRDPFLEDCRGAIGGIGKLTTGGDRTCPKNAVK